MISETTFSINSYYLEKLTLEGFKSAEKFCLMYFGLLVPTFFVKEMFCTARFLDSEVDQREG